MVHLNKHMLKLWHMTLIVDLKVICCLSDSTMEKKIGDLFWSMEADLAASSDRPPINRATGFLVAALEKNETR